MTLRGDVVLVDFPFSDGAGGKLRPALVVQNDRDNQKIRKTVIAMITGNLRRRNDPSHFVIDPADPDGATAGLAGLSVVSCNNLFTIDQAAILRSLGHLSDPLKQKLNDCLKSALELV